MFDVIPVDTVCNHIIVATAYAPHNPEVLQIYNSGTSASNPITLNGYKDGMLEAFRTERYNKQVSKISIEFIPNATLYKIKKTLMEDFPTKLLVSATSLPLVGNPKLHKAAQQLAAIKAKSNSVLDIFDFFVNGEWHYVNERIYQATELLSPAEYEEFNCETKRINWFPYLQNYAKGMAIWALMEDRISPEHELDQILLKNYPRFENFKQSFMVNRLNFKEKNLQVYEEAILNQDRFH